MPTESLPILPSRCRQMQTRICSLGEDRDSEGKRNKRERREVEGSLDKSILRYRSRLKRLAATVPLVGRVFLVF